MPSLIDIRRRIRSVKNTQQITRAMKMVSAAKLRRAQERVVSARPYARLLQSVLSDVAAALASDERVSALPLLAQRPEKTIQLMLVTADKGLAGAFNTNLIKASQFFLEEHAGATVEIEAIGRKGRDFWRKRDTVVSGEYIGLSGKVRYSDAEGIAKKAIERFSNGEIDAVYLINNEFRSVISQKLSVRRVLPVEIPAGAELVDFIFEQPPADMLASLLPKYVEIALYGAMLESTAAEHAARMTAMDAATSNASDMIEKLTLYMNRVRQASITKEIIEVVSGAAAAE
ncbi:MAG: ATP synthase F1 subunit gamma [Bryobacterales bacterium]|nr:ATP synthase F1 subunit gamma [Bryobacterales bacterium]